jgi:2-succinyl-6-hydroxy-2,4-cyclohexadiene-1-carboxylate synthase
VPPDELATVVTGSGSRLVLAHGFTQNSAGWGPFGTILAGSHEVLALDLPGHGGSDAVRADLPGTARLLGGAGGVADYLGYSLGGRVALHLALDRPDLVRRLVLVGATAGIVDPGARAQRREADEALALELETGGLEPFLDRWLAGPLFRSLPAGAAGLEGRRRNTAGGLASSLRLCGTGSQDPLWDRLPELAMPVLLLAGVLDLRFGETARVMAPAIGPNARFSLVPGAGHACQLERPALTARLVEAFLAP